MAQKRRLPEYDGVQDDGRLANTKNSVTPAFDEAPLRIPLPCARLSSDGTLSEGAASDGAQTAMTSVADANEDVERSLSMSEDSREDGDADGDPYSSSESGFETASLYPLSHHPRSTSPHGTVQLYLDGPRNVLSDQAASTRSLWVPDLDYRDIHGRRYCREYYMPNDEIEQLRLSLQHQVFVHLLQGEMTCVPLQNPKYILDVGTGTGEWPIRLAELFPDCEVVGTDISAIAETHSVPMNVFFEIEDAEDWDRPSDHYDLIHFRCMEGAFRDWRFIYDSAFDSLKPGGWIELIDFDSLESVKIWFTVFSEGSPIFSIARDLEIAAERTGRKRGIAHMDAQLLVESGFVDVQVTEHAIPMLVGDKSAGKLWLITCLDALEANCLRLLTQEMGWDPETCKAACEQAARELANIAKDPEKAKGLMVKARTVAAMKPLDSPSRESTSPSADDDRVSADEALS
ncbi:hypothetical protein L249_7988 [Ophiocordyceps polyrhachis-furcata BCC 54312]|uniref:Methyltransferase domain-containing protein n=1 Tax=Ophiocordyceps polyrhachis-furcata BCC 54312 TaxID=1330021 RepID=A0A367LH82_9HYPO|nr:hypothetical protein L249_7988 [Ophiocordyceps polyrhachis-furcata BCC 54312]